MKRVDADYGENYEKEASLGLVDGRLVATRPDGTIVRQQAVGVAEAQVHGDVFVWGEASYRIREGPEAADELLREIESARSADVPRTAGRAAVGAATSDRSSHRALSMMALLTKVMAFVIGAGGVVSGLVLIAYTDDLDERPFVGAGVSAIVYGVSAAALMGLAATWADAWNERTSR